MDIPLRHLVGADGLMQLLQRVAEGLLPVSEVLQATMRLHLPGYEQARPYFDAAVRRGLVRPTLSKGFFWQDELVDIVRSIPDLERRASEDDLAEEKPLEEGQSGGKLLRLPRMERL